MSKKLGYVQWFDTSGEGQIYCPNDKKSYYVHYSAIVSSDLNRTLKRHSPVEFTLYTNLYMSQINSVWPLRFNYSVASEHKLTRLMNECFENGDEYIFKLADIYYEN